MLTTGPYLALVFEVDKSGIGYGCVNAKVIEIIEMGGGGKSEKSRIMTKTLKIVFFVL